VYAADFSGNSAVLYITRASSIFLIKWAFLVCLACLPARAQAPEFLWEVDAHLKLNSSFRAYLEAKDNRDGGDPPQFARAREQHRQTPKPASECGGAGSLRLLFSGVVNLAVLSAGLSLLTITPFCG
jgi:hypothetical protein